MTIADATALLRDAGVASPDHDARTLLRHAEDAAVDYDDLVRRRAAREPLQHLIGTVGFRYVDLHVGPGVFVPRPETELVAGAALDAARRLRHPVVVDLCAGSGAIGLSVAHEHPGAVVHLVEGDPQAFDWLQRNGASYDDRVRLHLVDAADAVTELDRTVDVVVSNPPYVAECERALVEPEVRDHDPHVALFAGDDGLDVIRVVQRRAWHLLKPGGFFVVEHSDRQGESVPELLREHGWVDAIDHLDLTGRPRYATAVRP